MDTRERIEIKPQAGPQEQFLASKADLTFYGGAAGGGKSFALLIDPLRHIKNKLFRAVIFRREGVQLTNPGGLWDESYQIYPLLGAAPNKVAMTWKFPSGMEIKFAHLNMESDVLSWQGSQIAYIGFDEVTHFAQSQFFYMLSRLRSMSGVPGHIRATCNPDPDSWVAKFLDWWIDQESGFPIEERAGVIRWFIRRGDEFIWGDSRQALIDEHGDDQLPMSVTFIPAKVTDNKILLEKDPTYLSNLKALDRVERARLEGGNWKVRPTAGELFQRGWFDVVDAVPLNIVQTIRYWDRAATEPNEVNKNPDWTVGVKLSRDGYGVFYVEHVVRFRKRPLTVKQEIKSYASQDGFKCKIGIEKDPGQAGVSEADDLVRFLAGFNIGVYPVMKDKVTRAKPVSAQSEARNIKIVRGSWNEAFFNELEGFPEGEKDDQVDAFSGAFNALAGKRSVLTSITNM